MSKSRHRNRGRDVADGGLQRISYKFSSCEVEQIIRCESVEKVGGSVKSLKTSDNDVVSTDHSEAIGNNSTVLSMENDGDDPPDVSDARLLPPDRPDLADLSRQNGKTSGQVKRVKTWPPGYTRLDLAFSIISVLMFFVDLGTDVALVVRYHVTNQYVLRNLTLGFILVPALVSGTVSIVWSYIDYSNHTRHNRSKWPMIIRCVFTFLQLGRMYRMMEFVYHMFQTWKEKDKEKVKEISHKAIEQKRDAAILGLVDGFLESTLQLLLQLYLVIRTYVALDELRVLALLSSWFSTALTVTSYYRTVRRAMSDRRNVRYGPSALYMTYRLFELGPRFLLLGLCVAHFLYMLIGGAAFHVSLAFIMYMCINPRLTGVCNEQISRSSFLLLVSFISVFCFINLKDGKTLWVMVVYYGVFYLENFIMLGVVVGFTRAGIIVYTPWYYTAYSVIPGFVLHMLCLLLYYKFYHPQKTIPKVPCPLQLPESPGNTISPEDTLGGDDTESYIEKQTSDVSCNSLERQDVHTQDTCLNQKVSDELSSQKSFTENLHGNHQIEDDLSEKRLCDHEKYSPQPDQINEQKI
ncbi:XK-related protein 6-like [Ylistrum balloti]|uniref:XK-related protein 6-like n=1 Tax=Ylistrum balloti TaxID=509963 RepID=UPI002905DC03|nr:XK-related protein 6-like [Ylistrum balloti]